MPIHTHTDTFVNTYIHISFASMHIVTFARILKCLIASKYVHPWREEFIMTHTNRKGINYQKENSLQNLFSPPPSLKLNISHTPLKLKQIKRVWLASVCLRKIDFEIMACLNRVKEENFCKDRPLVWWAVEISAINSEMGRLWLSGIIWSCLLFRKWIFLLHNIETLSRLAYNFRIFPNVKLDCC